MVTGNSRRLAVFGRVSQIRWGSRLAITKAGAGSRRRLIAQGGCHTLRSPRRRATLGSAMEYDGVDAGLLAPSRWPMRRSIACASLVVKSATWLAKASVLPISKHPSD